MPEAKIAVRHDEAGQRFVADIDGDESGAVMKYRAVGERTLDYYSTFTPIELRGRGIAGHVVRAALDFALENDYRVEPTCPYVARVIERDAKYTALISNRTGH